MDNLFDRDLMTGFDRNCGCVPATNILEKEDLYEIQLAVPGMKKEGFHMQLEKTVLTVTYESKAEEDSAQEESFLRRDYKPEGFTRSFSIPKHADAENISARHEDGMLYISIPRTDADKNRLSKKIEIA